MRLDADEFIRRFLLHVLPHGFTRLRHYDLLANRFRAGKLARCRALLGQPDPEPSEPETTQEMMLRLTGIDITVCQQCGQGPLRQIPIPAMRSQTARGAARPDHHDDAPVPKRPGSGIALPHSRLGMLLCRFRLCR